MKSTIAVILLTSFLYGNAAHAAPCDKTDNECLLRLTLQQTYALEASRKENAILQQQLEEEVARDNGPKFFLIGMLAGIVFVGLGATVALKAIRETSK